MGESSEWVDQWSVDCELEGGARIRIPYDPDEIADELESQVKTEPEPEPEPETEPEPEPPGATNSQPLPEPAEADSGIDETPIQDGDAMPDENSTEVEETTAHEVQPSEDPLTQQFSELTQATGADPTLTIVLAILAVVGGGAAWKFYRQHSEQKHEQKMAQMKMDAKSKGMEGQSPGPCQTVHAQLKAEVEELKSRMGKMDKKLALNADFDGDDLERKVRKLEKWRRAMEEDEDE